MQRVRCARLPSGTRPSERHGIPMTSREKSLDQLFELFERPAASRAEVLEKTLVCALQLAEAGGAAVLAAHNRSLERWVLCRGGSPAETTRVGRPQSEFGRTM